MRRVVFAAEGLKSELICLSILTSFIAQQTAARTKRISLHCAMVTMFSLSVSLVSQCFPAPSVHTCKYDYMLGYIMS